MLKLINKPVNLIRLNNTKLFSTNFVKLNLFSELKGRDLISSTSSPDLESCLSKDKFGVYLGVDPTATSLHVGNLVALTTLLRFQQHGHPIVSLIGGATGYIGDPSGRSTERTLLTKEQLETNFKGIETQLTNFFDRAIKYIPNSSNEPQLKTVTLLNNYDWYKNMNVVEFLTKVGKWARVSTMLSRSSVKSRMEQQDGISFTEFSYQLIQAYDFAYLLKHHGCAIQIGGNDQWGNIVSGIELIHKKDQKSAYGITLPLLTTSSGEKFGKSAGNAIWLNSQLTSTYDFYQFFLKAADDEVEKLLKIFTFHPLEYIQSLMKEHQENPHLRVAQKTLAKSVTELVHGKEGLEEAELATSILFNPKTWPTIQKSQLISALRPHQNLMVNLNKSNVVGKSILDIALESKLIPSKGFGKKLIQSKGLYINGNTVQSIQQTIEETDLVQDYCILLRSGKSNYSIVVIN